MTLPAWSLGLHSLFSVWVAWDGQWGQPRPRTHYSHAQVFNSAITYRITNCSEFQMNGEFVLTAVALEQEGVFYAEVCVLGGGSVFWGEVKRGPGGTSPLPTPGRGPKHCDLWHSDHRG
jgi:hypothetical protein